MSMKMVHHIIQVGFAFFPFFFGASPRSRGSASAWPSRLMCSNSFVLLSNVSSQTLHCVFGKVTVSHNVKFKRKNDQKRLNPPGDTGMGTEAKKKKKGRQAPVN